MTGPPAPHEEAPETAASRAGPAAPGAPARPASGARDVVTSRVAVRARHFPDLAISPLDTEALDARDASLARAIDHAVARRWLTLVAVLESRIDQSWHRLEAKVKAPLLVGAAQLLLMDRQPEHAVINAAVEWVKRHGRAKAAGLVNAVLRRVAGLRNVIVDTPEADPLPTDLLPLHDGRAWRLGESVFAEDPIRRLGEQTSHPEALLEHWINAFGRDVATAIAWHDLVHPPVVLADLVAAGPEEPVTAHEEPGFHVRTGRGGDLAAFLTAHPEARVQDPTTAAAVVATRDLAPGLVVDVCAGLGTKTRQLAALHPGARVIASDADEHRRQVLAEQFAGDVRVEVVTPEELAGFAGRADLVVLDVPCSNTGVLARRVEAKYRFGPVSIAALVDLQRQIVADAIPLLADASHVLYATCSIEPAENERQAEWIARWHRMDVLEATGRLPSGRPGEPATAYRDGGYHALLRAPMKPLHIARPCASMSIFVRQPDHPTGRPG